MILEIVKFGHPTLRKTGAAIKNIDDDVRELAQNMLETMYDADGVGLAAQQVDKALMMTVIDVSEVDERPSKMFVDGAEVKIEDYMPLVLINPKLELEGDIEVGVEGCLSFPDITADISRPSRVKVKAHQLDGSILEFEAEGLLSRAVQHETDHLNGVLFIDRMNSATKASLGGKIKRLKKRYT